jgi:hypothetical protein
VGFQSFARRKISLSVAMGDKGSAAWQQPEKTTFPIV